MKTIFTRKNKQKNKYHNVFKVVGADILFGFICREQTEFINHRSITLHWGTRDFGPKPFCFYNFWLMEEGFKTMVEEWWGSTIVEGLSGMWF